MAKFLFTTLLGLFSLTVAKTVTAEVFVATGTEHAIAVYDNLDSGTDLAPKRIIAGPSTGLEGVVDVYVYSPVGLGRPSEIFACNESPNTLVSFPLDAEGDASPTRILELQGPDSCSGLEIHQDEIFVARDQRRLAVYPYDEEGTAEPLREITFNQGNILDLTISEGELFVFMSDAGNGSRGIFVFDMHQEGSAELIAKRTLVLGDDFDESYRILVVGREILVALEDYQPTGQDVEVFVATFDKNGDGPVNPIRLMAHPAVEGDGLMLLGDELFITDYDDGFYVFDFLSGGIVSEKRAVENDPDGLLGGSRDLFVTPVNEPVQPEFSLTLEEPIEGNVHSGIGNLRGWAVAGDGVAKVEVFVDGVLFQSAPYGGKRDDVGGAFPDVTNSSLSGFSLAYNYSALVPGSHTIMVRAHSNTGRTRERSATFTSGRPSREFVPGTNGVDLTNSACTITNGGIFVEDMTIDGRSPWDAYLKWREASQSFEVEQYIYASDSI